MDRMESIIADIDACICDRNRMEQKGFMLKTQALKVIKENICSFVVGEVEKVEQVLARLYTRGISSDSEPSLMLKEEGTELKLHCYSTKPKFFWYFSKGNETTNCWRDTDNLLDLLTDKRAVKNTQTWLDMFLQYFGTEEKTLKTVAKLKDFACNILQKLSDKISEENTEMASALDRLYEAVKESRSAKEREDGTVEIVLNGKTYIGTVKAED